MLQWFEPEKFGTYWSLLSASVNVAGGVVPLILPFLLLQLGGWRGFMLSAGILGLIWTAVSLIHIKSKPVQIQQPGVSGVEKKKDDRPGS